MPASMGPMVLAQIDEALALLGAAPTGSRKNPQIRGRSHGFVYCILQMERCQDYALPVRNPPLDWGVKVRVANRPSSSVDGMFDGCI